MEGDTNSVQCISIAFKGKKKKRTVLADNHSSRRLLQEQSQTALLEYYLKWDTVQKISRKAMTKFKEQAHLKFPDK